jgi:hypothetical protein
MVASWDRADHPSQRALSAFLDSLEPLLRPALQQPANPVALALDIGLPTGTPLTSGGRDLDNYLFPIVARFGPARFAAAWKQQLAAGLAASTNLRVLPPGPAAIHIAFRVGPYRNWANLWKPAIDALGGVLGVDNPARPFAPRDDRITELGLQNSIDPSLGHAVQVDVWWRPAGNEPRLRRFLRGRAARP